MATDRTPLERQLRELFEAIPPPPAPASWDSAPPPAYAPRRRGPVAWRIALAALLAVAVSGAVVLMHRGTSVSAITVFSRPAAADLSCRLPISALSADHTTGFIVFDHGRATFQPVRTGGTTYVPALDRWVDVLPQMVSPDGRSYVSSSYSGSLTGGGTTKIRVVSAAGARRVLASSLPLNLFAWTAEGILLVDMSMPPPGPVTPGGGTLDLELLDPESGVLRPFPFPPPPPMGDERDGGSFTYQRSSNAIWLIKHHAANNTATLSRYDLVTGDTTRWFDGQTDGPGHVEIVGANAAGQPIIQLATTDLFHSDPAHRNGIGVRTLLLTAPHTATVLNQGRIGEPGVAGNLGSLSVTDGNRIWLAADDGAIWTYTDGAPGLREVAKVTTSTKGPPGVAISGPCR